MNAPAKVIHMDEHRSSGPQLEDGYIRIANELFDAMLLKLTSFRHYKVAMAIARKTYGFGKKTDDITISQLAEITGIHRNNVGTAVRELEQMQVILPVQAGHHGLIMGINKYHGEWDKDSVKKRGPGRKAINLIDEYKGNQIDCTEQSKRCMPAINLIETGNQNVAHKRQPQKTTPKDNSKRQGATPKPTPPAIEMPDWMPMQEWEDFVAHRASIKKPLSDRAVKIIVAKLGRFKDEGQSVKKVLERSIVNAWQDVFAHKDTLADGEQAKARPMPGGGISGASIGLGRIL